ncbi:MAG: DUF2946 family protein [Burkholderiales bacterium]|nr:DUF2946 family protein [Burkholderiales bacterium]OJX06776.1 MAG: hypothetical protein BGO72_00300 [Burkholderiales bacterium 70-64]
MDEQVLRAMARWPDVPAAWGWLRLDRRGRWLLVDRGRPGFDEARDGAGSPITNPQIVDFIGRNYRSDEQGRWYWQNGPQRVYVDLEAAPLVLRVLGEAQAPRFVTHTGQLVGHIEAGWVGPGGEVLLRTDVGPAAVHDLDLTLLAFGQHGETVELALAERTLELTSTASPADTLGFVSMPRP